MGCYSTTHSSSRNWDTHSPTRQTLCWVCDLQPGQPAHFKGAWYGRRVCVSSGASSLPTEHWHWKGSFALHPEQPKPRCHHYCKCCFWINPAHCWWCFGQGIPGRQERNYSSAGTILDYYLVEYLKKETLFHLEANLYEKVVISYWRDCRLYCSELIFKWLIWMQHT